MLCRLILGFRPACSASVVHRLFYGFFLSHSLSLLFSILPRRNHKLLHPSTACYVHLCTYTISSHIGPFSLVDLTSDLTFLCLVQPKIGATLQPLLSLNPKPLSLGLFPLLPSTTLPFGSFRLSQCYAQHHTCNDELPKSLHCCYC